jgi:hypothetical protein
MSRPRERAAGESDREYAARGAAYQEATGYPQDPREARQVTEQARGAGAAAGTVLAGLLMIISGAITFLAGLAMVIRGGFFIYNSTYAYHWTVRGWGWTDLILGAVVVCAGVCVLLGMVWARMVGVILASLAVVASFLTIPNYPVWSLILIAIDLFIIWALVGGGMRTRRV